MNWKVVETPIINPPSDTSFTVAVNNLSADRDTGKIGSTALGAPDVDTPWGALFQNNDAVIYSSLKSSFGDRFMITFWMKLIAIE
jgi:hypothetical protein